MDTLWYAWAVVLFVALLWLYLSFASMVGTFLKQRRRGDDEATYGAGEGAFPADRFNKESSDEHRHLLG